MVSNLFYFPFHIWDVIPTPLTPSFFKLVIQPPTSPLVGESPALISPKEWEQQWLRWKMAIDVGEEMWSAAFQLIEVGSAGTFRWDFSNNISVWLVFGTMESPL